MNALAKTKDREEKGLAEAIIRADGKLGQAAMDYFGEGEFATTQEASGYMRGRLEHSKNLRHHLSDLLDKQGLSLSKANVKLKDLLEAKKPVVVNGVMEMVPDNNCQTVNLHKLYDLHQAIPRYGNSNFGIEIDNRSININLDNEQILQLKNLANELKDLNTQMNLNT